MRAGKLISGKRWIAVIAGVVVVVTASGCIFIHSKAKSQFIEGTVINGIDVSGMNIEELEKKVQEYTIDIVERDKDGEKITETINGNAFDASIGSNDEEARKILENQGMWQYIQGKGKEYSIENWLEFDEEKLEKQIENLKCFDTSFSEAPKNAYISEYSSEDGYKIVKETSGNTVDKKKAKKAVLEAVHSMKSKIDIAKEKCYKTAAIKEDDEQLNKALETLNKYTDVTITYQFDDNQEVLDGSAIAGWLTVNKKNKVVFEEEKVADYVATLRKKYDTIFSNRKFKTSYGNTITVTGGDYGWWMNYQQEEKELIKQIKKGKSGTRTPVYHQTAESYGKHDYGNSYVEINLTTQHIFLYIDGKKILESDCVTGNSARGYDTPEGTYSITYTQRDATLVGETYSTPVKYWMPFNRNIGLHDANWRNQFGGTLYKTNGSHGCVNLPPANAQRLFKYVKKGMPVICYNSEETLSKKNSDRAKKKTSANKKSS